MGVLRSPSHCSSRRMERRKRVSQQRPSLTLSSLNLTAGQVPWPVTCSSGSPSTTTAAYCHFGRDAYEEDGKKFFSWENVVDLSKYSSMKAADVAKTVTDSQAAILKKWVD